MCSLLKGHTKKKIMNLFRKLKLELHIFQQYFTLPPHHWNMARAKSPWVPSTPILLTRSTIPFSKCFQSYGYIKKHAPHGLQSLHLWLTSVRMLLFPYIEIYEVYIYNPMLLRCCQTSFGEFIWVKYGASENMWVFPSPTTMVEGHL
jgi:hypothetical protein